MIASGNISQFKRNKAYSPILEHVTYDQGYLYLAAIKSRFKLTDTEIAEFCTRNDGVGDPIKWQYGDIVVSPTSLRYIYHALLILEYCKNIEVFAPRIVEVGCGYGGLALAVDQFSNRFGIEVSSYTLIDLDEPSSLQQLYLSMHSMSFAPTFESASTYGANVTGSNNFLISNYCFSEIPSTEQQKYMNTLFPKCSHGFMVWNMVPQFDFGKNVSAELESPLTGGPPNLNYYLYF
jgi:hypothetical protein